MKNIYKISAILLLIILSLSCKKSTPVARTPAVSTSPATKVLYFTAIASGSVIDDGGVQVYRGVCWGTVSNPTLADNNFLEGTGIGDFSVFLTGLTPGTTYYVRAYATNSAGVVYGDEISFKTHVTGTNFNLALNYGTLSDIEGKSYKTIPIAGQVWMAENLRTVKFNDGSDIPVVKNEAAWSNSLAPAYCWFNNNDTLYQNIYGAYYNWYAVNTGKLCPTGWHVPDDSEWQTLVNFLGTSSGSKIKEAGDNNWIYPDGDATNQSGFTAIPAGLRQGTDGTFGGQGNYCGWWSATEVNPSPLSPAWIRWVQADTTFIGRNEIFKNYGSSVRCIKN